MGKAHTKLEIINIFQKRAVFNIEYPRGSFKDFCNKNSFIHKNMLMFFAKRNKEWVEFSTNFDYYLWLELDTEKQKILQNRKTLILANNMFDILTIKLNNNEIALVEFEKICNMLHKFKSDIVVDKYLKYKEVAEYESTNIEDVTGN